MKSIFKMVAKDFMAHALLPLLPLGVLSTRVNPDTFRIHVDGALMCLHEQFLRKPVLLSDKFTVPLGILR